MSAAFQSMQYWPREPRLLPLEVVLATKPSSANFLVPSAAAAGLTCKVMALSGFEADAGVADAIALFFGATGLDASLGFAIRKSLMVLVAGGCGGGCACA